MKYAGSKSQPYVVVFCQLSDSGECLVISAKSSCGKLIVVYSFATQGSRKDGAGKRDPRHGGLSLGIHPVDAELDPSYALAVNTEFTMFIHVT